MKKIPLSYYIKLYITEECIKFYDSKEKNIQINKYFSMSSYIETYIRSGIEGNHNLPSLVTELIRWLNDALGVMFGFNSDIATKYVIDYFIDSDYKKYLEFVTYRDRYVITNF